MPESHPSPFPVSGEEEALPDALPLSVEHLKGIGVFLILPEAF